jgi:phage gp29-like protein
MAQTQGDIKRWLQAINPFARNSVDPSVMKKDLRNVIAPVILQRVRQDVQTWRDAVVEAENAFFPHRVKAQRLFIDTINNGHVYACMERRKDLTMLRKWEFVDKDGKIDQYTTDLFTESIKGQNQNKEWFNKFISISLDALFYGYSLITLGDIINGEFPNLDIIKRWNVSPDRNNVTNFTYSISGELFLEEPYKDWHVWVTTYNEIGSSKVGFGLLYKVALYEIFLRNTLGFNGDFVELFAQPFRVGKTTKTMESERAELAQSLQQMGSAGWALIDPEDDITFLETALGGTGFQGYDNFDQRLEKKISKLILGHADAIDSVPGKLGSGQGGKTQTDKALEDKQTKDGSFICNVVNGKLFENMRALGFAIPPETRAVLKNDAEIMELNSTIIDQAVKMHSAGLQMDSKYFTKLTGIPVSAPALPSPIGLTPSIKNKLQKIYNKHEHH